MPGREALSMIFDRRRRRDASHPVINSGLAWPGKMAVTNGGLWRKPPEQRFLCSDLIQITGFDFVPRKIVAKQSPGKPDSHQS